MCPGVTGGLLTLVLVFRNNASHARFNEARHFLSILKNSLRTICSVVLACGTPGTDPVQRARFKRHVRRLVELSMVSTQVFVVLVLNSCRASTGVRRAVVAISPAL